MTPAEFAHKHLNYAYWETQEIIDYLNTLPEGFTKEAVTCAMNTTHWGIYEAPKTG